MKKFQRCNIPDHQRVLSGLSPSCTLWILNRGQLCPPLTDLVQARRSKLPWRNVLTPHQQEFLNQYIDEVWPLQPVHVRQSPEPLWFHDEVTRHDKNVRSSEPITHLEQHKLSQATRDNYKEGPTLRRESAVPSSSCPGIPTTWSGASILIVFYTIHCLSICFRHWTLPGAPAII